MTRVCGLPVVDIDIITELRRQLDEAHGKRAELERTIAARDQRIREVEHTFGGLNEQIEELRTALLTEAEAAAESGEADEKPSRFWFSSWTNSNRRNAQLLLENVKLRRWLDESGREATKLQGERDAARDQIGRLTRQLELARAGERCDRREVG